MPARVEQLLEHGGQQLLWRLYALGSNLLARLEFVLALHFCYAVALANEHVLLALLLVLR